MLLNRLSSAVRDQKQIHWRRKKIEYKQKRTCACKREDVLCKCQVRRGAQEKDWAMT